MPFSLLIPIDPSDLEKHYHDKYVTRSMIERVFTKSVISESDLVTSMDDLAQLLTQLLSSNGNSSTADVQLAIEKKKKEVISKKLVVDNEVPHTKWLYEYLTRALDKKYVVKRQSQIYRK